MIKQSIFEQELITGMQQELYKQTSGEAPDLVKAGECLHAALEILEEAGFISTANQVLSILAEIAEESKHKTVPHHKKDDKKIEFTSLLHKDKPHKKNPADKLVIKSLLNDDQDAKGKSIKIHDPHTKGLTPDRMVENLKHHGIVFNLSDDGKADTLLDVELDDDNDLEVIEENPLDKSFEDES